MQYPEIRLHELDEIDSTNTYAVRNFSELADGTLVTAKKQTLGKGRLGRRWVSPAGVNIYASLVMKQIANPFYATITASLSVLEMLQKALPQETFYIKWPNDIYIGGSKISGILCEASIRGSIVQGVIAGMGVNINLKKTELDRIGQSAASLKALSGREFDVKKQTLSLADSLKKYYALYLDAPEKLFAEWKDNNIVIGNHVRLSDASGENFRSLFVRDIAPSGELIVEENGQLRNYNCGDVTLDKESLPIPEKEKD